MEHTSILLYTKCTLYITQQKSTCKFDNFMTFVSWAHNEVSLQTITNASVAQVYGLGLR